MGLFRFNACLAPFAIREEPHTDRSSQISSSIGMSNSRHGNCREDRPERHFFHFEQKSFKNASNTFFFFKILPAFV
jgi:hypothetical protein